MAFVVGTPRFQQKTTSVCHSIEDGMTNPRRALTKKTKNEFFRLHCMDDFQPYGDRTMATFLKSSVQVVQPPPPPPPPPHDSAPPTPFRDDLCCLGLPSENKQNGVQHDTRAGRPIRRPHFPVRGPTLFRSYWSRWDDQTDTHDRGRQGRNEPTMQGPNAPWLQNTTNYRPAATLPGLFRPRCDQGG